MAGQSPLKVLLIYPAIDESPYPPLGIAYLGAVAEAKGCEVQVIVRSTPVSCKSNAEIVASARAFAPDVVGVTVFDPFSLKTIYELAAGLSALGCKVIGGGPHATICSHEALNGSFDIIARGEGEETFAELLDYVAGERRIEDIAGISYHDAQGQIVDNPDRPFNRDLDSLQFPAKHLFKEYLSENRRLAERAYGDICSSRGCPSRCAFCCKTSQERTVRLRSAASVFAEMLDLKRRFGTTNFYFVDDTLTVNKKRIHELCDMIVRSEEMREIKWNCQTRVDCVDKELLEHMKQAGCEFVIYGVESGDPETLRKMHKNISVERTREVTRLTHQAGIQCFVNFMYGFPEENLESLENTFKLIKDLSPYVNTFSWGGVLVPHPGTEIYEQYKEKCGFQEWWLKDRYVKMAHNDHVYNLIGYYCDGVLDIGFFLYSPPVKKKIRQIHRYIARHNLKALPLSKRVAKFAIAESSVLACAINPWLDRKVVLPAYNLLLRQYRKPRVSEN